MLRLRVHRGGVFITTDEVEIRLTIAEAISLHQDLPTAIQIARDWRLRLAREVARETAQAGTEETPVPDLTRTVEGK